MIAIERKPSERNQWNQIHIEPVLPYYHQTTRQPWQNKYIFKRKRRKRNKMIQTCALKSSLVGVRTNWAWADARPIQNFDKKKFFWEIKNGAKKYIFNRYQQHVLIHTTCNKSIQMKNHRQLQLVDQFFSLLMKKKRKKSKIKNRKSFFDTCVWTARRHIIFQHFFQFFHPSSFRCFIFSLFEFKIKIKKEFRQNRKSNQQTKTNILVRNKFFVQDESI